MQVVKQLGTLIQQATSDSHSEPPRELYHKILGIINTRVDMPKHTINAVSKRLTIKNRKVLYYCFDLLEYLSYYCQLSFYSQITTKEFLFKISGLLVSEDLDNSVQTKILQTIKCWEELFRPHEDLLPMFFQFYAGVLRKGFPIQKDYVSPHRPKDFKVQKPKQQSKKQQQSSRSRPVKQKVEPSRAEQKTFEEIRQRIILINQIIDNASPAEGVKGNALLLQMMEELKACEKKVKQTIDENPNQRIMELAIAANDDIYITYRRFKELQKNRKPEPFILTELASDAANEAQMRQQKKIEESIIKPKQKIDQFQNFNKKPQPKALPVQKKPPVIDIFDLACESPPPKVEAKVEKKAQNLDLISHSTTETKPTQPTQANTNLFDLLGQPSPQVPVLAANESNPYSANLAFMNSNYLGFSQPSSNPPAVVAAPINPGFQNPSSFQSGFNMNQGFQSSNFGSISLGTTNFQTENDLQKHDPRSILQRITDISDILRENK